MRRLTAGPPRHAAGLAICVWCACSAAGGPAADAGRDLPLAADAPGVDGGAPAEGGVDAGGAVRWDPGLPDSARLGQRRGLRVARGVIHAHSVNSHDACDGRPRIDGAANEPCLADLRRAVCATRLDFLMLTEHISPFAEVPFADGLLARGGDAVLRKDGHPVAVAIDCGADAPAPLLLLGVEAEETMPVGLERHPELPAAELPAFYASTDPAGDAQLRAAGAVLLQAHLESKPLERLLARDLDGVEVYNLHANLAPDIREEYLGLDPFGHLAALGPFNSKRPEDPEPDLAFLSFFVESDVALDKWHALLGQRHTAGVLGTDAHQNVLPLPLRDGERMDSYRRNFRWFSNHYLVEAVSFDAVKQAVARGRGAMVFEILGTPEGFDFFARAGAATHEMGDAAPLAAQPTLELHLPRVLDLPPGAPRPALAARIIHIDASGAAQVVAEGTDDLVHPVTAAGAYRAEVRIVPEHLRPFLGREPERYLGQQIWIYANPIYVE